MNKLINTILSGFETRERDVLIGRFGLMKSDELTLAEIGKRYDITRERVRQIEELALTEARKKLADPGVKAFIQTAVSELKRMGGVARDDMATAAIVKKMGITEPDGATAAAARFIMELSGKMYFHNEDEEFYSYWHLGPAYEKTAHAVVGKLAGMLKTKREEILKDTTRVFQYLDEITKSQKVGSEEAKNYLAISKKFMANPFGDYGLSDWGEINPKTARDWAYLVVKKENRPLHFTELVKHINTYRKNKITNVQTVHNELIKDDRFVLVGRGTYGIQEFGIMPGTAREVIAHFIKKEGPLPARDVVKFVLQKRLFKEGTILINLQNKNFFKRLEDGRYTLSEA